MSGELERLRARIEAVDADVVRLLARRFRLVRELLPTKEALGIPIEDRAREVRLRELYTRTADEEGLDPAVVQRIFDAVLAESKRAQEASSKRTG